MVGLNFDFLSLNVVGFVLYSVFNVALYWIPGIQADYFQLHPTGVNPVQVGLLWYMYFLIYSVVNSDLHVSLST